MNNIPNKIDSSYYDEKYFSDPKGKEFRKSDGTTGNWGYQNLTGEWLGCKPITETWKTLFKLKKCKTEHKMCKVLDIGCGRGQFVTYLRDIDVEAWGFDYSNWAIKNRYPRCQQGWIIQHDATMIWPYGNSSFDLVIALDLFEHIYLDDIDKVINEMYRVTKKWIFLQIATVDGSENGYILKKGDIVPVELESMAVAGHVTVQMKEFWIDKLMKERYNKWKLRNDLVTEFIRKVPGDVISNWVKNTLLIIEKV